jgi:hypothetical protein
MELWRKVWRGGFAPVLTTTELLALRTGLASDDRRLIPGATCIPPPMQCVLDWPVDGACFLGYCAWQGDGKNTVGEVEEFFAHVCFECDARLCEPAACRHFLNWCDDTPRDEVRRELLAEINAELSGRTIKPT